MVLGCGLWALGILRSSFYQPFRHNDILSINTGAQLVVLLVLFAAMFLLLNDDGGTFVAVMLVCLAIAPLMAGIVLTLRLPEDAIAREAGDALSKDLSDAVAKTLSAPKLPSMLGSFRKKNKGGGASTAKPVTGEAGGFSQENPMHRGSRI